MRSRFVLALGLAASFLLTSCVVDSVQPLASPDQARPDPRLAGVWRDKDGGLLTFRPTHGAWMHVKMEAPPANHEQPGFYDVFPTTIGDTTFLNVKMDGKDPQGRAVTTYIFIRYTISPGHLLRMWQMSQDASVAAVRAGKLKGHVVSNGNQLGNPLRPDYDVTLEDTGAVLTKFIQGSDIPALFNDEMNSSTRVGD